MNKNHLLDELQERLGSEATKEDAEFFAQYLYEENWLPNDLDAMRGIPQDVWDKGLKILSEKV